MALTYVQPAGGLRYRHPLAYPPLPPGDAGAYAPPDTDDVLTAPAVEFLAPQVARLAPRGRAWNTDEAAAPFGSRVQHGVWRLIAAGLVEVYVALTRALRSAFPGRADAAAILQWESEVGLPDACAGSTDDLAARRRAVQAARTATDGASRHDMLRLALRAGATATIEISESRGFNCSSSPCGAAPLAGPDATHQFYVSGLTERAWLTCGGNTLAVPLGQSFTGAAECAIRRAAHSHTRPIFEISGA